MLGASGYTGADAVRLLARHPGVEITALTANTHAGKAMAEVFPHFFMLDLPALVEWEKVDWTTLDAVFCGLPHGTTQEIIAAVLKANPAIKSSTCRRISACVIRRCTRSGMAMCIARRAAKRGGLRADRACTGKDHRRAAGGVPRLLSDSGVARAGAARREPALIDATTSSSTRSRASPAPGAG